MNAADRQKQIAETRHAIARLLHQRKQALAKRHSALAHRLTLRIEEKERHLRHLEGAEGRGTAKGHRRPQKPSGVHDPYAAVVITPQNAARLRKFYERKLRQWFLTPREKAWWSGRLNSCLAALRMRSPHRKDVRSMRRRAAELRRKAVAAKSLKRYAQASSYVRQAENLEQSAAAEVDWQPTGEGFLREKFEGEGAMTAERDVQAEGGEREASRGDAEKVSEDAEAMEKPWYARWWVWGLGVVAVGALAFGGKRGAKSSLRVKIGRGFGGGRSKSRVKFTAGKVAAPVA